ncbi:MAG: glutamate/gamma-aminobutyrate family transporter YjeM, partial [Paeniclostridium sordellii]|nr:glutamate/gamma-aminobutyrate family transporter YjeM [Paeniclostridium sordellii]
FPAFKKKQLEGKVDKAFVVYKSVGLATTFAVIIGILVGFANVFTIIEPVLSSKDGLKDTLTMIGGPAAFALTGFILFTVYENKHLKKVKKTEKVVG